MIFIRSIAARSPDLNQSVENKNSAARVLFWGGGTNCFEIMCMGCFFFSAVKGTSNHEKRCTVVTINSSNLLFVLYQSVPCQPCLVCTGCFFFQVVKGISNHERCTAVVTVYSSNLLLVLYQTKCAMSTLFGNAPINKCCYYNNTVYYTSKYCLYLRVGLPFRA